MVDDTYRLLWLAKIQRMFKDATADIKTWRHASRGGAVTKLDQTRARDYFRGDPFIDEMGCVWASELEQDCEMAGLTLKDVKERADYFRENGWRDDAGELSENYNTGRFKG